MAVLTVGGLNLLGTLSADACAGTEDPVGEGAVAAALRTAAHRPAFLVVGEFGRWVGRIESAPSRLCSSQDRRSVGPMSGLVMTVPSRLRSFSNPRPLTRWPTHVAIFFFAAHFLLAVC